MGKGKSLYLNVKPAVGFTLPSAGVTPAPSDRKSQNGEDAILLSGSSGELRPEFYLARYFHGRGGGTRRGR